MRRGIGALVVVALTASMAWGAAPPVEWRALTAAEEKEVEALGALATRHEATGDFERAVKVYERVEAFRRRRQGGDHWQAVDARLDVQEARRLAAVPAKDRAEVVRALRLFKEGTSLHDRRQFREAEKPLRHAMAAFAKVLGQGHPLTARSYSYVAFCLRARGKSPEALPLFRKALDVCEKSLGRDHPDTAAAYNNVAVCLEDLGKSPEALPLYRKALGIREKVLGPSHPDTATSYNNVAFCLQALGKSPEALPLYRKALGIREKSLGGDHPDTAAAYNNVASCLDALGKSSEALPLYRKATSISEKAHGQDHPDTALFYNNVAYCLDLLGKSSEALPLFRRALSIREKALGQDHPYTAQSYNNVAFCLQALGKSPEALPLYRKALGIREKVLGPSHPDTATSYITVAYCLDALGRSPEALPLYRKAHDVNEKVLGPNHPTTATSSNNVAACLIALGKQSEALPLFRNGLEVNEKVLGPSHPLTATSYNNLALCLFRNGRTSEAARLLQRSMAGQEAARFHLAQGAGAGFDRAVAQGSKVSPRAMLAVLLAHLKQPRNAFAQAEASLARGLLDDLDSPASPDAARLREWQSRLKQLDAALIASASIGKPTEEQRASHEAVTREQRAVLDEITRLVAADSARRVLPLAHIQRSIPHDAALVLWIDGGARWACVVRRGGAPEWVPLPGSGEGGVLTEDDKTLPARLHAAFADPATTGAVRRRGSNAFVKQLFDPLRPHLKEVKRLFVVPSGPLAQVPLDALVDDFRVSYVPSGSVMARTVEGHRALDGKSLLALGDPAFDAPALAEPPASGVLLTAVTQGGHAAKAGMKAGDVLLSVGDVAIDSLDDLQAALKQTPAAVAFWRDGHRLKGKLSAGPLGATPDKRSARAAVRAWRKALEATASRGTGHKRLPGTRVEAEAIAAMVKGSTLLLGSDASEQRLDALLKSGALKKHRLLHFATHGDVVEQMPGRSAMILAQDRLPDALEQAKKGDHVYDGRLTVSRIRTEWKGKIDADLVVLSACETGLGKDAKGDGLLGFAQAFLSAGARSVILSRWPVDDVATSLLMRRFYQNLLGKREGLKKPLGRAASLHEAKEWLRGLSAKDAASAIESLPRGKLVAAPKGEGKAYEHPYYWAAFTLIGDPD